MPTRIKICGITRVDDAMAAAEAGAHAIGLMFYPQSPRVVALNKAMEIRKTLPPFVAAVAVFLDPAEDEVHRIVDALRPDLLQFHGREPEPFCLSHGLPYIKGIPMSGVDPKAFAAGYSHASGFLLDSHAPGQAGGTGQAFDWSHVPQNLGAPVILAGGLNPDNVEIAVRESRPYGVDVSSGVESSPGIKDPARIKAFINGVQRGEGR